MNKKKIQRIHQKVCTGNPVRMIYIFVFQAWEAKRDNIYYITNNLELKGEE